MIMLKCWMEVVITATCAIMLLAVADIAVASKSQEQKIVEALDLFCMQNADDFSLIDKIVLPMGGKEVDEEITAADQAISRMGGKSYFVNYLGADILVGYTIGGGCAIFTQELDSVDVVKILTDNYKIKLVETISEGFQIQRLYEFSDASIYAKGIVSVTHAKDATEYKTGSIAFVPPINLRKASEQSGQMEGENKSNCTLSNKKKGLYREVLCRGNSEYSATNGPDCQEEMLQKRVNDSAIQIISGRRCGFSNYSSQLKEQLLGTLAAMQKLYDCIGVNADTNIVLEKAFGRAERIAPSEGSCPVKLRSRLRVRLPELVRMGKAEIREQEVMLKNIGYK